MWFPKLEAVPREATKRKIKEDMSTVNPINLEENREPTSLLISSLMKLQKLTMKAQQRKFRN